METINFYLIQRSVCRGGTCPRRYGCVFWVEKRLRDASSALAVQEIDTVLHSLISSNTDSTTTNNNSNSNSNNVMQVLKRSSSYGPREYLHTGNSGDGNAALLELIHIDGKGKGNGKGKVEDDDLDLSSLLYYTRAKGGVVPCESPLGPPPRVLAF